MPQEEARMTSQGANTRIPNHAADPFFWLAQAKELDKAAMLVWRAIRDDWLRMSRSPAGSVIDLEQVPHARLGGVFWLNAGLALENLFKGIIIKSHPEVVANGAVTGALKTHNLVKLARDASYELDVPGAFFLWVGTKSVIWAGRYPCSTKPGESKPPVFSEADVDAYKRIFEKLVQQLDDPKKRRLMMKRLV